MFRYANITYGYENNKKTKGLNFIKGEVINLNLKILNFHILAGRVNKLLMISYLIKLTINQILPLPQLFFELMIKKILLFKL